MIGILLAAALSVVSSADATPDGWACAYAAERLPRALLVLGEDAISGEETRATRNALDLPDGPLSRATSLILARKLGATRLIAVRCSEASGQTVLEAQAFATAGPEASVVLRASRPTAEVGAVIDDIARLLTRVPSSPAPLYRAPSLRVLQKVATALRRGRASERAVALAQSLVDDPASIDVRLSLVEALLGARDFDSAARLAAQATLGGVPSPLARALRFRLCVALLESGRYAEARDALRLLASEKESAAVLNNLGVALFRLRDPQGPSVFDRAAALPDHRQRDVAFNHALTLVFQNRGEEAIPKLDAGLAADPGDARSRLLKVWALATLKRDAERDAEWERLVDQNPSFAALGKPDPVRRLERIFPYERTPAP